MQQVSRGLRRDSELAGWLDSLDDLHKIVSALTEADYHRTSPSVDRSYNSPSREMNRHQ
jgi:hypothetical protein